MTIQTNIWYTRHRPTRSNTQSTTHHRKLKRWETWIPPIKKEGKHMCSRGVSISWVFLDTRCATRIVKFSKTHVGDKRKNEDSSPFEEWIFHNDDQVIASYAWITCSLLQLGVKVSVLEGKWLFLYLLVELFVILMLKILWAFMIRW